MDEGEEWFVMDSILQKLIFAGGGGGGVSGEFTVPDSGSTYEISFGKTISNYLFLIEATDDTKTAILNSGQTSSRAFAFVGVYPKREANDHEASNNALTQRLKPSDGSVDASTTTVTCTDSAVSLPIGGFGSGVNYVFAGCTYKYVIAPFE